jgi:putative glutamine amidotransferase
VNRPSAPLVVVTVADPARRRDPALATRKNELYAAAIARHGGTPLLLDASSSAAERTRAFDSMTALLLSGGADIEPARYGRPNDAAGDTEPDRDELEAAAWAAAGERALPVLGVCRGLQAINVFSGGTLLDVPGHEGPSWGSGPALTHPLRVEPGTRLARILFPTNVRGGVVEVNSHHHQAIGAGGLAPGLVPNARAASRLGELIEGIETRDGRFVLAVQCHPERQESMPKTFERLFAFFVDAARGPIGGR